MSTQEGEQQPNLKLFTRMRTQKNNNENTRVYIKINKRLSFFSPKMLDSIKPAGNTPKVSGGACF